MKGVLATGLAAVAAALALGTAQPSEAQTRCRWVGRQMQCQDARIDNNYNNNNYNNYNNRVNGYYQGWKANPYPSDNSYYHEQWQDNRWRNRNYNGYYTNRNGYYNNGYYNNGYYNNGDLRRAINEIYRQELGRNADSEGLRHYIDQYYNGWSLGQIRSDIATSREARYRY